VFLFDEFYIPRRVSAATVQGLRGQRANEGDLASMSTLNSKAQGVDIIAEGHRLRWTKQLALRGKGRSYDEHGMCGKQRLVISSDLSVLVSNAKRLFPGASITTASDITEESTMANVVIKVLSNTELPSSVTTRELGKLIGKPWRLVSSNVLTPEFKRAIDALGWRYVPGKGRSGSRFERTTSDQAQAA